MTPSQDESVSQSKCSFGVFYSNTSTWHEGFIDEKGKMAYKEEGNLCLTSEDPTPLPVIEPVQLELGLPKPEPKPSVLVNINLTKEDIELEKRRSEERQKWLNETITEQSWVRAPRWAGFDHFLRETCMEYNVVAQLTSDGGWLFKTTYYTLTGERRQVQAVEQQIQLALKRYIER
jgi:hypothetical protein